MLIVRIFTSQIQFELFTFALVSIGTAPRPDRLAPPRLFASAHEIFKDAPALIGIQKPQQRTCRRIVLALNPCVATALWLFREVMDSRRGLPRPELFAESGEPLAGFCNDGKFNAVGCNDFARVLANGWHSGTHELPH